VRLCTLARAAGLTLALVLAGCVSERGVMLPDMHDWSARQRVLEDVDDWSFAGRIGVQSADEGFNGRVRWRQSDAAFNASVSGPLGAGAVQIDGDGQIVQVTDGGGEVLRLEQPERDLQYRYGWTLPVNSLRYWALGIPDPATRAVLDFAEDGTLAGLEQGGWVVNFPQYRHDDGQLMPRRIVAANGTSRVRLVIDDWVFY